MKYKYNMWIQLNVKKGKQPNVLDYIWEIYSKALWREVMIKELIKTQYNIDKHVMWTH